MVVHVAVEFVPVASVFFYMLPFFYRVFHCVYFIFVCYRTEEWVLT